MTLHKTIYTLAVLSLFGLSSSLSAGIPDGYYSRIDGQKKADLKAAVKASINSGKKVLSYNSLWGHYEKTYIVSGTSNQVFDYYSPMVYYYDGKGGNPSGANKEHCCPQSWWGGGASCNSYSDLFNVMPSEVKANSAKSNYPVGEVGSNVTYTNERMKVGTSAGNGYSAAVFEPCDEYKGDFARIYLYVATCYDQAAWGSKSSVASTCAFNKEAYPTIKSNFLSLLLKWHREDPVSQMEIDRNDLIYKEQNNRNPFIDYPQLAEYIWGDSTTFAFDLANAKVNGYGARTDDGNHPIIDDNDDDDDDDDGGHTVLPAGTIVFADNFDDIDEGSNTNTGGSSTPWSGNDLFVTTKTAYQAGGAVRLGSSKNEGSMTSGTIDFDGGKLAVSIEVKGWDNAGGKLTVTLSGAEAKTLTFSATMSDAYETVNAIFDGVAKNPVLMIATAGSRCFINSVKVVVPEDASGIEQLTSTPATESISVDLLGRRSQAAREGLFIKSGKLIYIK